MCSRKPLIRHHVAPSWELHVLIGDKWVPISRLKERRRLWMKT